VVTKTLQSSIVKKFIPPRRANSRKGENGTVLVVGGSYIYHGAPILSSLAALRAGTDLVYTSVPKINTQSTRAISPNLIVIPLVDQKLTRGAVRKLLGAIPKNLDSATIGMGLAIADKTALKILIQSLLEMDVRLSLDASALLSDILPQLENKNVVVTPHSGEFKRLFGEIPPEKQKPRISVVEKFAKKNGITILVAGILAKNRNSLEAAAAASFVNGLAGKLVQKKLGLHMTSMDLIDVIPQVMKPFDKIK
jgi:NAD(P)H-hydrate epimerase